MEEFSGEELSAVKRDKKNLLLTSKDPHLSHLFGDDPRTPNSVASTDQNAQSVMEDSSQFHDDESREPEYRLFDEQSYVPDLSPSSHIVMESNNCGISDASTSTGKPPVGAETSNTYAHHDRDQDSSAIIHQKRDRAKYAGDSSNRKTNGPVRVKPYVCKESGCNKAYSDPRSLRKHMTKLHSSDQNNNDIMECTMTVSSMSKRDLTPKPPMQTSVITSAPQQTIFSSPAKNQSNQPLLNPNDNYPSSLASSSTASGQHNGPTSISPLSHTEREVNVKPAGVNNQQIESLSLPTPFFTPPDNSNYNMQLLAHSAQQLLQRQHVSQPSPVILNPAPIDGLTNTTSTSGYNQSSSALQHLAIRAQMRLTNLQDPLSQEGLGGSTSLPMLTENQPIPASQPHYLPVSNQISDVRVQLRKSLSANGKMDSALAMNWPRMGPPMNPSRSVASSSPIDPMTGQANEFLSRISEANDPTNIDNAPLLKNLLARTSSSNGTKTNTSSQQAVDLPDMQTYIQQNISDNNWAVDGVTINQSSNEPLNSPNLQSPAIKTKRAMFQYQRSSGEMSHMGNSPDANPSPLNSPSYQTGPHFPQHNQTTPLPQNDSQQFFTADDIMVNNNNNQQMTGHDTSSSTLNDFIAESENLVQDFIDEVNANSNQSTSQQLMPNVQNPFVQGVQSMDSTLQHSVRVTPPPAYRLNPHTGLIDSDMSGQSGQMVQSGLYLGQNGGTMVKTEPQSPMITSPMGQRMFFNPQSNAITHHQSQIHPLGSPSVPHPQASLQGMHPTTPTGDPQWQFPLSTPTQNYMAVPQSPTTPMQVRPTVLAQDGIMQKLSITNTTFLPRPRPPSSGNPKAARTRRTSGGSTRKNPDGTLSCAICGHSFRSVPALNGHMRVHSSSSDKKNKDERLRKASGSSNGGSGPKTPHSLSSPTTPTFKSSTPTPMYQNTAAYNNVTLSTYSNPTPLYNPTLNNMERPGAVVTLSQHDDSRKPPLVHRITQQAPVSGLYPYPLSHPQPMHPHDALLAAANFLAHSESDLIPYVRNQTPPHSEYQKVGGHLSTMPELQNVHYVAQQPIQPKVDLPTGYHKTPPHGMILVQPQTGVLPSYLPQISADQAQVSNIATLPFVSIPSVGNPGALYRQSFAGSPPEEHANPAHLENFYLTMQQPLMQQTNHRSTPLADFADIAVAHNKGQLFTSNSVLMAPLGTNPLQQADDAANVLQQQHQDHVHNQPEQMQLQDLSSDVGLLASVSKDLLWRPDSQPTLNKMDRNESIPLKDDFLPSSMGDIHKPQEQMQPHNSQSSDPFIFPVSVPVHCSRDESAPVTSTGMNSYHSYGYDDYSHLSAFHDDQLMQDAINVANPSKILPNSMMGGNPSGPTFRSIRQRHHSEGSVLKKIFHDVPPLPIVDDLKVGKMDMVPSMGNMSSKTPPACPTAGTEISENYKTPPGLLVARVKRKLEIPPEVPYMKKLKVGTQDSARMQESVPSIKSETVTEEKEEIWTVPKYAPPNRTRHRRHSADSRVPYRSGSILSRPPYVSQFSSGCMGASTIKGLSGGHYSYSGAEHREKRRPPPLIIPASVNAYSNGTRYMSHLHHRRRPSGDSTSSCGGNNDKIPPYTPPPMLSPMRIGTGLFHCTPITPSLKPIYRQSIAEHGIGTIPEEDLEDEFVRSAEPKINIGSEYQAELPDLLPKPMACKVRHNAELVWTPSPEMQKDCSTQSRHVEEYMKLACSAAVPHGGCNKEYALHLLHKNNGDILKSVQQLLTNKVSVPSDHWMATYKYTGASWWSLKDRQSFERASMQHHKDFYCISKIVKTMSTAQCVDYYYHTVKRKKRRIQRPRRFRHDSEDEENLKPGLSSPTGSDSYNSGDDFMHDHAVQRDKVEYQESNSDSHPGEVVRRSPTSTSYVRVPHPKRPAQGISHTPPPPLIDYSPQKKTENASGSVYHRIHNLVTQPRPPTSQNTAPTSVPHRCKMPSCNQAFSTAQLLLQHQQSHKGLKPYLERLNRASPSPASSPSSAASADTDAPQPVFSCPRCGKTFLKVKSRNAHMKTHGKHAQEKRRQKEEEARRKEEEAAVWRNRAQQQQQRILPPPGHGRGRGILQFQITKPPGM